MHVSPLEITFTSELFRLLTHPAANTHANPIHRDLKPSNILIGSDNQVHIADLGVAKNLEATDNGLTSTGRLHGTLMYMAPEQHTAPDTVDARSDLYSLGVTFYELLTNRRPLGAWEPASKLNSTVPVAFDRLIQRLLAHESSQRIQSAAHLFRRLKAFTNPKSETRKTDPETNSSTSSLPQKIGSESVSSVTPRMVWESLKSWGNALLVLLYVVFVLRGGLNNPKGPGQNNPRAVDQRVSKPPAPTIVLSQARYIKTNLLDWDVEVVGQVRNEGGVGSVTVYAGLVCGDRRWVEESVIYQLAGATSEFRIRFKEYTVGKAQFAVGTARESVQKLDAYHPVAE